MSLVDHLLTKDKLTLAKELAATAKENAELREKLFRAEVELFWMKVRERDADPTASHQDLPAG